MTEAMPFLQKYDITFLRPPTIEPALFCAAMPNDRREGQLRFYFRTTPCYNKQTLTNFAYL